MTESIAFKAGGYRYLPAVFQYSAGVAAEPGYVLEQARFVKPMPLAEAYRAVEKHLKNLGRPSTAFAHCELRTPQQFNDQGFIDFNREYVKTLEDWGIYQPEGKTADGTLRAAINPVARTNVCPQYFKPDAMAMFAFTYTMPSDSGISSFMLSGGGEARKGSESYRERIAAFGDTSASGLRTKLDVVLREMSERLQSLGFGWDDVTTAQLYSVQDMGALVGEVLAKNGHIPGGVTWHYARPPVTGLEVEMDLRGAVRQIFIS
ncbi:MAG: cnbZ [Herminiimonas sp.]|nr:cnbZ [Herminiimonas sp.]